MRAYVLHAIEDFRMEEVPKPVPGAGEVLLAVKAAGICGSDIPRIYRTGTYSYPLVPGHEFSGVVVEAGIGVDREWLGRKAGVFPMIPCGHCAQCRQKSMNYAAATVIWGQGQRAALPTTLRFLPGICLNCQKRFLLKPLQ